MFTSTGIIYMPVTAAVYNCLQSKHSRCTAVSYRYILYIRRYLGYTQLGIPPYILLRILLYRIYFTDIDICLCRGTDILLCPAVPAAAVRIRRVYVDMWYIYILCTIFCIMCMYVAGTAAVRTREQILVHVSKVATQAQVQQQ